MYVRTDKGIAVSNKLQDIFGTGVWSERIKRFVEPGALPPGVAAEVDDEKISCTLTVKFITVLVSVLRTVYGA